MPLTQLSGTASMTFAFSKANNVFSNTTTPATSISLALGTVDLTKWNQEFAQVYTLFTAPPAGLAAGLTAGGTLTVGTTYYYKVTAVGYNGFNATNETSGSNETSITPTTGNQTASLTWTALPQAVSYNVYRGTAAGLENVLVANVTGTSYSDTGTAGSAQSPPGSMPADFVEFDLSSFTNLASEACAPGHVLGIIVAPTGTLGASQCTLTPGTTNGLTWFFSGTTPGIAVPINCGMFLSGNPADTGAVIDGTHKTLRITNAGTAAVQVAVGVICGK